MYDLVFDPGEQRNLVGDARSVGAPRGGAVSIGEMKFHVALDSLEMRRVYEIAPEMKVPVMMHIQVFPHFQGEEPYNTDAQPISSQRVSDVAVLTGVAGGHVHAPRGRFGDHRDNGLHTAPVAADARRVAEMIAEKPLDVVHLD